MKMWIKTRTGGLMNSDQIFCISIQKSESKDILDTSPPKFIVYATTGAMTFDPVDGNSYASTPIAEFRSLAFAEEYLEILAEKLKAEAIRFVV